MTTKDRLHQLVNDLPEGEVADAAERLLKQFHAHRDDALARTLLSAPIDDEPETEEERTAIAEARAALARGDVVRDQDLDRELGW